MVIHENIYVLEPGHSDLIQTTCPTLCNIKDYLCGKLWIEFVAEVFLHTRRKYYTVAAIAKVEHRLTTVARANKLFSKLECSTVKDWGYRPVLVGVVQISKAGEQLQFRSIPSVIRLEVFDNFPDTTRFIREPILRSMVSLPFVTDRELATVCPKWLGSPNVEFVGNMVKGTTQAMGEVAYQQSPIWGEGNVSLNEILQIIPRFVLGDGIWVAFKEITDTALKSIQVKLGSSRFESWPIKRMHNTTSNTVPILPKNEYASQHQISESGPST